MHTQKHAHNKDRQGDRGGHSFVRSLTHGGCSAGAKRDFANVTLPWVKNCQNIKINLARCLILSVAGSDRTLWRRFCRETARVSTAHVVRGVSPGVPQWGAPRGRASYCAKHRGAKRDFALCPVGAPQGDVLVHSGWENSVNMPSVPANTSTEHSQEDTLLFQKKKNLGFCRTPWGHPQSHSTKVMLGAR